MYSSMTSLDSVDMSILSLLASNARRSYRNIAEILGTSHATVYNKIRRLEAAGVIKGYTTLLDYEKIGFGVTAVIHISVTGRVIEDLERALASRPEVQSVYDITGEFDILAIARFPTIGDLDKFIKWLNKIEGVKNTRTSIVFKVVKENPASPLTGMLVER